MARTVADLKTESLIGFDSTVYSTYVDNWLKDAQDEVARRANGAGPGTAFQLGSLAFGAGVSQMTFGATLPPYSIVPFSVQYQDGSGVAHELTWMDKEDYFELMPTATWQGAPSDVVGNPTHFSIFTGKFFLYPAPSAAITVRWLQYPNSFASSFTGSQALGQVGYIHESFADTIVCYVRSKLFRYEDDFEMAGAWESAYERNLAKVASTYSSNTGQGPRQVQGMLGQGGWYAG